MHQPFSATTLCVYCKPIDVHAVEPAYKGHPWDTTKWLLYRGGLLIEIVNNNGISTILQSVIQKRLTITCAPTCPVTCTCELDHRVERMASDIVGEGSCHEWSSYVRVYRVYQAVWISAMGEMPRLAVEPMNSHDMYVVAVMQDGRDGTVHVVGRVPRNFSGVNSFSRKT